MAQQFLGSCHGRQLSERRRRVPAVAYMDVRVPTRKESPRKDHSPPLFFTKRAHSQRGRIFPKKRKSYIQLHTVRRARTCSKSPVFGRDSGQKCAQLKQSRCGRVNLSSLSQRQHDKIFWTYLASILQLPLFSTRINTGFLSYTKRL